MRNLFFVTGLLAAAPVLLAAPLPALGQTALDGRVDRLEREMRAVQRKVFPGGTGQYVEPQITAPGGVQTVPGTPATSPTADLDARVVSLERQAATVTGGIEQLQYKVRQLEDAFAAYKRSTDARLTALEATATSIGTDPVGTTPPRAAAGTAAVPRPVTPKPGAATPAPTTDTGRAAKLAAIERPSSGDAGEDAYLYGYRLWEAKMYPEAETALKSVVEKYPKHRRASFAQNLLGRAYLDEGRPSLASIAFYDSFKKFPDGERAPDSLYYLAQALMKLNKPADACKVYAELDETYATKIDAAMRARIVKGRADAKCK